ncbi:hypothetical protein AVEN_234665-1 [Araneus ventricosus]|uniref:Uncharacterized protein n=1 Tax=Araneus ventricosus TaxID=182803 RepID=A0A4Y2D2Q7_ARAVE|nr:hypothetical protein AVEN_234665-1 [Araneus ventricosus]
MYRGIRVALGQMTMTTPELTRYYTPVACRNCIDSVKCDFRQTSRGLIEHLIRCKTAIIERLTETSEISDYYYDIISDYDPTIDTDRRRRLPLAVICTISGIRTTLSQTHSGAVLLFPMRRTFELKFLICPRCIRKRKLEARKYMDYSAETLEACLNAISQVERTLREAGSVFGISKQTIC